MVLRRWCWARDVHTQVRLPVIREYPVGKTETKVLFCQYKNVAISQNLYFSIDFCKL